MILSGQHYDYTVTIEIDHDDVDIEELECKLEYLIHGLGFSGEVHISIKENL